MSFPQNNNLESPSYFLDFENPDGKCSEGIYNPTFSPSLSFELQDTDVTFKNLLSPRPVCGDSILFFNKEAIDFEFEKGSFRSIGEDQYPSFRGFDENQKNVEGSTDLEEFGKNPYYMTNALDSIAQDGEFSIDHNQIREVPTASKRHLEPEYYEELPSESNVTVCKKTKTSNSSSSKRIRSTKEDVVVSEPKGKRGRKKIIQDSDESEDEKDTPKKTTRSRISMTKNYKGVLSSGLVRFLLEADEEIDSGLYQMLLDIVQDTRSKTPQLQYISIEDLFNKVIDYAREEISGKVEKESKNGKQSCLFKVGSVASFKKVFYPGREDSTLTAAIKNIIRNLFLDNFFESKYYYRFLTKLCKAPQQGRMFLFMKVDEIQKTLKDPYYRPDFQYDQIPLLHRKDFPADAFMEFMEILIQDAAVKHAN